MQILKISEHMCCLFLKSHLWRTSSNGSSISIRESLLLWTQFQVSCKCCSYGGIGSPDIPWLWTNKWHMTKWGRNGADLSGKICGYLGPNCASVITVGLQLGLTLGLGLRIVVYKLLEKVTKCGINSILWLDHILLVGERPYLFFFQTIFSPPRRKTPIWNWNLTTTSSLWMPLKWMTPATVDMATHRSNLHLALDCVVLYSYTDVVYSSIRLLPCRTVTVGVVHMTVVSMIPFCVWRVTWGRAFW